MADPKETPATQNPQGGTPGPKQDTGSGAQSQQRRENEAAEQAAKKPTGADLDRDRATGVRTGGTSTAAAKEYAALRVNPRLDNRIGSQRPQRVEWPAKPQQIDGPEVGHFAAHDELTRREHPEWFDDADLNPRGMKAEGPHSMGPHGVTVGDAHGLPVPAVGSAGDEDDPRNPA